MNECLKYKKLLMGLMDNELTSEEIAEVQQHLTRCADCRKEYEQLKDTGAKIKKVSFEEPQDKILQSLWRSPFSRFARMSGLLLVIGGWLALLIYALIEIFKQGEEPVFTKVAIAAVFIGFFVLLATVIRDRLKTYKTDPYKEVER
jgi:hypothetical protein